MVYMLLYANIYHQYSSNVIIYTSTMDPSYGNGIAMNFPERNEGLEMFRAWDVQQAMFDDTEGYPTTINTY